MTEFVPTPPAPLTPQLRPVLRVELDGEYAGWWAEMEADPTIEEFQQLDVDSMEQRMNALMALVFRWNFTDRNGAPIAWSANTPAAAAAGFDLIRRLSVRAIIALRRAYIRSATELPNRSDDASSPG